MPNSEPLNAVQDLLSEEAALTPAEIVAQLDRYIVAQDAAKRAVAIALRNRWRRLRVAEDIRDEITPKNIIMIGPTGVGKTEIARRLAKLARAPFVKVEASKFTEVGYVGRDVESIIRDLVESAHSIVREEEREQVRERAEKVAEERLLDLLLPGSAPGSTPGPTPDPTPDGATSDATGDATGGATGDVAMEQEGSEHVAGQVILQDDAGVGHPASASEGTQSSQGAPKTREKLRKLLRDGKLDERIVEIETARQVHTQLQVLGPQGFSEIEGQIKDMFSSMVPRQTERRKVPVAEARRILTDEAQEGLLDEEAIAERAVMRAEQTGIVFIDEIDKVCGGAASSGKGPDVSREGVQRDLLPLVEGSTVHTKYGMVSTDHMLFIASGAFHLSKPSDLMPEFQGRFPIRVELETLTAEHFVKILTEPENALTKQYAALLKTEEVTLEFTGDGIHELAMLTAEVNSKTENIGARRLHTLLEKLLDEVSFDADARAGQTVVADKAYVAERLRDIVADTDLSRFVL